MSTFEFVLILFAIIIGFGVAETLKGWGDQLRSGRERSALQIVATAYVLAMSFRYVWMQWMLRDVDWGYGGYLLGALQPVAMALAARVLRFDPADPRPALEQYLARRRVAFGALALFPISNFVRGTLGGSAALADASSSGVVFVLGSWTLLLAVCVWLAWSPRVSHHWLGLGTLWLTNLAWSIRVQPSLPGGG